MDVMILKEVLPKKKIHFWNNKVRLIFAICCFIVGIGFLSIGPIRNVVLKKDVQTVYEVASNLSAEEFKQNAEKEADYDYSDVQSISMETVLEAQKTKVEVNSIGLIAIPELDMKLAINHGSTNATMLYGAATVKPQIMGEGNYVLASHSVNQYGGENMLFTPLWRTKLGMKIYLTDGEKVYTYTISEHFMVGPNDTWVMDDTADSRVTLITCDVSTFRRVITVGKLDSVQSLSDTDNTIRGYFNIEAKTF